MHGHALAARDVADDGLAQDGVAALGAIHHQVVDAAHLDDVGAVGTARSRPRHKWLSRMPGFGRLFLDHAGRYFYQHLARGKLAVAERRVQVFGFDVSVVGRHLIEVRLGHLAQLDAKTAGLFVQVFLADLDRLDALTGVDEVLDLVARARGLDERQPVLAGLVARLRHDLDDVAVAQRRPQRYDAAVHLGAHAGGAHVGVNGVSEIDRRGVARQHQHLAARRKGVDLFGVQVHFQGGHELAWVLYVALPFHQVPQPRDALIVGGRPFAAFFVLPVRGDSLFGDAVHFLGANLHFERLPMGPDHGSMQRLVEVGPRDGDEVLDAARDGAPLVVDHSQRGVAILHRIGENAQGHQVVNLIDQNLLAAQLLEDRERPFHAAVDARGDAFVPQFGLDGLADLGEKLFVGMAPRFDGEDDLLVGVRLQVLEGEVLEFVAHLAHAQAVRDGRVDLDGLARNTLAPLGAQVAERPHVVDPVGQLYQDDADVLDHGQQHFAEAFGLPVLVGKHVELGELGDAIHAARYFFAEFLAHLVGGDAGVFHHVVRQPGFHGHHINAHVRQDVGHHDRVHHVGLARIADLVFMVFAGEAEGFLECGQIVLGTVLADLDFKFAVQLLHRVGRLRRGN